MHLFRSRSYALIRAIVLVLSFRIRSLFHKNSGRKETLLNTLMIHLHNFLYGRWYSGDRLCLLASCSYSKGRKSVKNWSIVSQIDLILDIFMINLYTKFDFSVCYPFEENERRLQKKKKWNFFKSKGHFLFKIVRINLYTKFDFSMCNHFEEKV